MKQDSIETTHISANSITKTPIDDIEEEKKEETLNAQSHFQASYTIERTLEKKKECKDDVADQYEAELNSVETGAKIREDAAPKKKGGKKFTLNVKPS